MGGISKTASFATSSVLWATLTVRNFVSHRSDLFWLVQAFCAVMFAKTAFHYYKSNERVPSPFLSLNLSEPSSEEPQR